MGGLHNNAFREEINQNARLANQDILAQEMFFK